MWPTLELASALSAASFRSFIAEGCETVDSNLPFFHLRFTPESRANRAYCLLASLWLLEYADRSWTAQFDIPVESFNLTSNFLAN